MKPSLETKAERLSIKYRGAKARHAKTKRLWVRAFKARNAALREGLGK